MSSYAYFAGYYDELTRNVDYGKQADYLEALCHRLGHAPGLSLDLACGTGSLTVELCRRGWDIYGVDGSPEMLSAAMQKASEEGLHILFLCQKMQRIDLYGTVDTVVCTLDSINHLTSPQDVQRTFDRVSLFLNPGGYFIFDANTIYKHVKQSVKEQGKSLEEMLKKAGLEAVEVFHEQSFEPPREASQRLVYAARKPMRK